MSKSYVSSPKDQALRIVILLLFSAFSFCWLYFFQGGLMEAAYNMAISKVGGIEGHFSPLLMALVLTGILDMIAIGIRTIGRADGPFVALDYIVPSVLLGAFTSFDGTRFFSQSSSQWICVLAVSVLMLLLAAFIKARSLFRSNDMASGMAVNLMLMPVMFGMTVLLGNTDELYHKELLVDKYVSAGRYEKALQVGRSDEESSIVLGRLRADAMIAISKDSTGAEIGNRLFDYVIASPSSLSAYLKNEASRDSLGHDNLLLAAALLDRDLEKADTIFSPSLYKEVLPKFFMQAFVISENEQARDCFPDQYAREADNYRRFMQQYEESAGKPLQYRRNSCFMDWHDSYFWYYQFR